LPPYLDGRVGEAELREQIEHHARLCPECGEELAIVRRALEPDPA
jgi:Putative zinc-finger